MEVLRIIYSFYLMQMFVGKNTTELQSPWGPISWQGPITIGTFLFVFFFFFNFPEKQNLFPLTFSRILIPS